MVRLLPHDDDDDDSRDDLIFEISMEFSRKLLFLLLSRFQKEQRCFTNHTNATIDKASFFFFFFFFFQNVKRSLLLLAKRRKGSGERIHTERTEWSKKASFSSDARKKERKERPKKQKEEKKNQEDQKKVKKSRNVFLHQKGETKRITRAFSSSFRY